MKLLKVFINILINLHIYLLKLHKILKLKIYLLKVHMKLLFHIQIVIYFHLKNLVLLLQMKFLIMHLHLKLIHLLNQIIDRLLKYGKLVKLLEHLLILKIIVLLVNLVFMDICFHWVIIIIYLWFLNVN